MHVSSLSFAYPEVDSPTRAELTQRLLQRGTPPGVFVLATCLRLEIAVEGEGSVLEEAAIDVFGEGAPIGKGHTSVGEDAVHHLFRIAAGLESPILGEREIHTQFRQAVAQAEDEGLGGLMAKLLENAVAVGRQARELLPDSPHDSMAAVAAQVVGPEDRVAVLGSGMMATSVVMGLLGLPAPPDITVVARTPDRVPPLGGVEVWPFDRAAQALGSFPAVVSATSAKHRLIADEALIAVLADRSTPLVLVDMAMPPDFSPPEGSPVRYVDIDDLARIAARRPRKDDADAMVAAAAGDAYRRLSDHHAVGPVIGGLMQTADAIVDQTVGRFAGRLSTDGDRDLLRQTAHTVARTLLSGPVSYLRSTDRPAEAVDTIAEAFGLDDE